MIRKDVNYIDPVTEESKVAECYFHLSKAEILQLEVSCPGGLEKYVMAAANSGDREKIFNLIWKIVVTAYGTKTDEGFFMKTRSATEAFAQSEAFGELLVNLLEDPANLEAFIKGVAPKQN